MKKNIFLGIFLGLILLVNSSYAQDLGSKAALQKQEYSIEEMLNYAMQDEILAKTEYEKILEKFPNQKPFTNILESENQHISLLNPLFETYNIKLNDFDKNSIEVSNLNKSYEIGRDAEIANIKMYESFLKQNLPNDIKEVFEKLKNASENHLKAFEKNLNKSKNTSQKFKNQ